MNSIREAWYSFYDVQGSAERGLRDLETSRFGLQVYQWHPLFTISDAYSCIHLLVPSFQSINSLVSFDRLFS